MSVNGEVLFWTTWSAAFAMWLLVFMYGFWQMARAAVAKQRIAQMWAAFLGVWVVTIPVAMMLKAVVN